MGENRWDSFDLLSVAEAAGFARCSQSTVRRAIAEGRLPYFRLRERGGIRIPFHALEELIKPHLVDAVETATAATSELVES